MFGGGCKSAWATDQAPIHRRLPGRCMASGLPGERFRRGACSLKAQVVLGGEDVQHSDERRGEQS